ncbi:hypothetical protein H5410_011606 [Solanum commersonii]|uniref:Uncharacterized protein n=1 Tax=Solanum commersonii TaxID=4109 RepID=A0A9J6APV2_SOLCO|nr:hypothetical protein H5410_011606 [Solanum commersonii]
MANNTKKLLASDSGPQCWTFFSTATFGKQNKVPQESIPNATAEKVKEAMLEGVEKALGLSKSSLKKPFYTKLQLWYEVMLNNLVNFLKHVEYLGVEAVLTEKNWFWVTLRVFYQVDAPMLGGAALPTNTPGIPCIFDPRGRAGICGDWLLGSSLEAAALSGIALADQIADYFEQGGPCSDEFAVGLHDEYKPLEGHDIGQFPGLESVDQITNVPALTLAT